MLTSTMPVLSRIAIILLILTIEIFDENHHSATECIVEKKLLGSDVSKDTLAMCHTTYLI